MYRVLRIDNEVVVLANTDGQVKRIDRSSFSFVPRLGDRVDLFQDDNGEFVAVRAREQGDSKNGSRHVRSALLQGIFDLFMEIVSLHNDQVGDLKRILTQIFITFFMIWGLLGVVVVEIIIFIESLLIWAYQLALIAIKYLHDLISRKMAERDKKRDSQLYASYQEPIYEHGQDYADSVNPEAYDEYEGDSYIIDLDSLELSPDESDRDY
ncbi:hypothetical protein ACVR0S_01235 [Streptococcus dentapri]|uniref:Uncharacterized protein n=1 Tax=Streptococcus dentapri TaxID=573564 RepID=A0ABV8D1C0_9STRE